MEEIMHRLVSQVDTMSAKLDEVSYIKEVEKFMRRLVSQVDKMSAQFDQMNTKLDEVSSRLDDHIGQCNNRRCAGIQQAPADDIGMKERTPDTTSEQTIRKRRYRCSKEENQEESLRKSLQENIVLMVENVPFSESLLPDMLISRNCLSENETQELRKLTNEKDQIRNVIRLLKGRSYEVMSAFLDCLQQVCPHVANKISATYDKKVCEYNTKPICGYCKLNCSVDLKFLADHVWSIGLLGDLTYNEIVIGNRSQNELWTLFAEECNKSDHTAEVIDKLVSALKEKGFYKELASKLETLSELTCTCSDNYSTSKTITEYPNMTVIVDGDQCSTTTTASPTSSVYTGNGDASRNGSDLESEEETLAQSQLKVFLSPRRRSSLHLPPNSSHVGPRSPRADCTDDLSVRQRYGVRKPLKTPYDMDLGFPSNDLLNFRKPIKTPYDLDPVIPSGDLPTVRRGRRFSSLY